MQELDNVGGWLHYSKRVDSDEWRGEKGQCGESFDEKSYHGTGHMMDGRISKEQTTRIILYIESRLVVIYAFDLRR